MEAWKDFTKGAWTKEVNVRDFILKNYSPYEGDDRFLAAATDSTNNLWQQVMELTKQKEKMAES